ncbi:putative LOG family protein [Dioscorea sansibarensis]
MKKMEEEKEITMSKFKKICVYCGSSQGKKKSYQDAANDLAKKMVLKNIDLVYGGGSLGLMGLIFQAVFDSGRHVLGYHITGVTMEEVKQVVDMLQRKAKMARHSDAFIALPGWCITHICYQSIFAYK